jgi:hypothetical protein
MKNVRSLVFYRGSRRLLHRVLIPYTTKFLRILRHLLPYPRLWSLGFNQVVPDAAFAARSLRLNRPESISVSGSGDRIVISNSGSCEITVFLFGTGSKLHASRYIAIKNKNLFNYAHGAVFGSFDHIVLALGEYSHALSAISMEKYGDGEAEPKILWSISGRKHGLHNPADLALHPSEEWLVVANRKKPGLSFLRFNGTCGTVAPILEYSIDVPTLNAYGVAAPHGVAFSTDGDFMFVTHKRYANNPADCGHSALTVFKTVNSSMPLQNAGPLAIKNYRSGSLHHVACHPSLSLVAITNSLGTIDIYEWNRELVQLGKIAAISAFRIGEGMKGIAFTNDGACIMVTSELNEILLFRVDKVTGTGKL